MRDYSNIGLKPNLQSENSILNKQTNIDALRDNSRVVDTAEVTTEKMKNKSVTSQKFADGAVQAINIGGSVIAGTHLANESVDSISIVGSAVDGTHLADGALEAVNFGGSVIAGTHIGTNTINANSIVENSITATEIGTFDFSEGTGNIVAGIVNAQNSYQANGTTGFSGDIDVATTATISVEYGLVVGTN